MALYELCSVAGVTILLSLTVFLNLVAETLPQVSDAIPLLGTNRSLSDLPVLTTSSVQSCLMNYVFHCVYVIVVPARVCRSKPNSFLEFWFCLVFDAIKEEMFRGCVVGLLALVEVLFQLWIGLRKGRRRCRKHFLFESRGDEPDTWKEGTPAKRERQYLKADAK